MSTTKALKEAIEIFELRKKLNGWLCEADTVAIAALCDAEQREKGCRYCNGNISDALGTPIYSFKVQYFEIGDGAVHMLHARYCPMCDRQLKEDI